MMIHRVEASHLTIYQYKLHVLGIHRRLSSMEEVAALTASKESLLRKRKVTGKFMVDKGQTVNKPTNEVGSSSINDFQSHHAGIRRTERDINYFALQ